MLPRRWKPSSPHHPSLYFELDDQRCLQQALHYSLLHLLWHSVLQRGKSSGRVRPRLTLQCWCGSTFDPVVSQPKLLADSKCAAPCKGDAKDMCGGTFYQIAIYTTPNNPTTGTTDPTARTQRRRSRAHGHHGGQHHGRRTFS